MVKRSAHIVGFILAIIFVIEMLFPASTFGQEEMMGIPYIKNYSPAEYNAHVQNFDIVQNQEGIMYFANFSGVLEFDGQSWRVIQTANISQVTALSIDSSGIVYVGARGEVGRLMPNAYGELEFNNLTDHIKKDKRAFQYVINTFATENGVYFVTNNAVLLWQDTVFKDCGVSGNITSAFYLDNKLYFFDETSGFYYLQNNKKNKIYTSIKITGSIEINAMIPYGKNNFLVGIGSKGLLLLEDDTLKEFNIPAQLFFQENYITSGVLLNDKSIALGTMQGGLAILSPDGELKQTITQGIQNEFVRSLFVDNRGLLWLALDYGIANAEFPSNFSFFNENIGLEGKVNDVLFHENTLYFATYNGLFYYKTGGKRVVKLPSINVACWAMTRVNNEILAATSEGVFVINALKSRQLTDDFSLSLVQSKIEPKTVYVGLLDGVKSVTKQNNKWQEKGKIPGLNDEVTEIKENEAGILSMAISTKGIIRYDPKTKSTPFVYDEKRGLPSRFGNHLNKLNNGIIISTQKGLFTFNEESNKFSPLKAVNGDTALANKWIHQLKKDYNGNTWFTAGDGKNLQVMNNKRINTLLKPLQNKTINKIIPFENGNVWFITPKNTIRFDPGISKTPGSNIYALTRKVMFGGDSILFGGYYWVDKKIILDQPKKNQPLIKYKDNSLFFKFSCPSYNMNEEVEFQYFLKGFDEDTSAWSSSTTKEYTNIPPGNYHFLVKARNVYGVESKTSDFGFSIDKPFYMTIFAYVLYGVALILVIVLIARLRSKKLVKEKQKLAELVKERTTEVTRQKEEIEKQSKELSNKNQELEKINMIVKSINSEIHFSNLLQSILEKTTIIKGVEKATMIVRNKSTNIFTFKAALGWDVDTFSDIEFTLCDAEEFYLANSIEVFEDIFDVKKLNYKLDHEILSRIQKPKSILIMTLKVNKVIEGFLILENMHRKQVFSIEDFSLLRNLKEHFIAAFIKTNLLENIQTALTHLKNTQEQLIQKEKLASIGQLTKGIVDRLLNPLNYINNFTLLSKDLAGELNQTVEKTKSIIDTDDYEDMLDVLSMVHSNLDKIHEHGNSASRIVKGMEQLLKQRSTEFMLTDINALVDSNIEIAIQEYKAENQSFQANIVKDFDKKAGKIKVLPPEIGTVVVHLVNNACFAVDEKAKKNKDFKPQINVSTAFLDNNIKICIRDNGLGMPKVEKEKLFAPFYTTKPTSKGTGLGLYMSMDIMKAHKGSINLNSKEGEYTEFVIILPKTVEKENDPST